MTARGNILKLTLFGRGKERILFIYFPFKIILNTKKFRANNKITTKPVFDPKPCAETAQRKQINKNKKSDNLVLIDLTFKFNIINCKKRTSIINALPGS